MAVSIDWGTRVISVPRNDLTLIQSSPTEIREMNLNWFRLQLKDLEDSEDGMAAPDTHRHNTEVSLGGLTYARVIEIINDYTITFEDGQYAVNLVGANSNVGDCVNVNQVSVRSANSAGLITSPAIEYASYNGCITVDLLSPYSGTIYPIGTPQQPVNNMGDALLIATYRGFNKFYLKSNMTIDSGGHYESFVFAGESSNKTVVNIDPDANVRGCEFTDMEISGTLDGGSHIYDCRVGNINYVDGIIENCVLLANKTITLSSQGYANINGCFSGRLDSLVDNIPIVDMGVSGTSLAIRNYNGTLRIINKGGPENVDVDLNSGILVLDETVSAGTIQVRGIGELVNNSTGTAIIDSDGLLSKETIAAAVYSEVGEEIQFSAFDGVITIDVSGGVSGTAYPIGTVSNPVNNIEDALIIAEDKGITEFVIKGCVSASQNLSGYKIKGYQTIVNYSAESDKFVFNNKSFADISFEHITLTGTMSGGSNLQYYDCYLIDVYGIHGSCTQCSFKDNIQIKPAGYFSGVGLIMEGDYTTVDLTSTPGTVASFDIESGYMMITNSVSGCLLEVNLRGGELELDSSITGGDFYAEGYGTLFGDPESLGMNIKANHLLALETIPGPILDALLSEHTNIGSLGEAIEKTKKAAGLIPGLV